MSVRARRYVRDVVAGIWYGLTVGLREFDRYMQAGFDRLWYGS